MAASGGRRVPGAALILLATVGAVLLVVAAVTLRTEIVTSDGEVCASAWHYRPGHGSPTGGEQSPEVRAEIAAECRAAARDTALRGLHVARLGGGALALAAIGAVLQQRHGRRSDRP